MIIVTMFLILPTAKAQIIGLWEVESVQVGEEMMTPVAKWFKLMETGKLESGNGGIRNTLGYWRFDLEHRLLYMQNEYKKADPYGPFDVSKEEEQMIWSREEDGMQVTVLLKPVEEIPLAPWDKITGSWKLSKLEPLEGAPLLEFPEKAEMYVGWDGRYRTDIDLPFMKGSGYWHIQAHRPEMITFPYAGCEYNRTYQLTFKGFSKLQLEVNDPENGSYRLHFSRKLN
jgi:hypothetical protein